MRFLSKGLLAAAALSLCGCSTVERAREAQRDLAPRGESTVAPARTKPLDLRGYDLEALVAFAMTNRPSVVSARLAVDDARLALRELAADAPLVSSTPWTAPKASLSGGHSESSRGTTSRARHRTFGTDGKASASLSLDVLVWDFGRYGARAKAQGERVVSSELKLLDEGFAVFGEVSKAYFDVMEKWSLLEVAFTNESQYAAHLSQVEERIKAGEAYKLDLLRARLDLSKARERVVVASNNCAIAGAELMKALGVDASRGTFEEVFEAPTNALFEVVKCFSVTKYGAAEAFEFARTNAPSVQVARAKLRAASSDVDYAVADLGPSVSASLSLRWADPLWYWGWGVDAVQSVFQGFRKTTAVDRSVVALRSAAAEVDRVEQALSANVEVAVAARDTAVAACATALALKRSAKENLDTALAQFRVGDVDRIELSDSIAEHSAALGDLVGAFYAGQRAEAALFALLGTYPQYRK